MAFVIDRSLYLSPEVVGEPGPKGPLVEEVFGTLPHFASWIERQPADKVYCYTATGECLVAQYFKAHEPSFRYCGPGHWTNDKREKRELPAHLDSVARGYFMPDGSEYENCDRTFGAALSRAEALLAEREK